jgi:ABC-type Fe3+ transport system permease subunit
LIEKSLADKDIVLARAQIEDLRAAAAAPAIMDADRAKVNARADEFRNHVDALEHARNVTIGIAVIATVAVGVCGAIVALLIRRRRAAKIHTPPDA